MRSKAAWSRIGSFAVATALYAGVLGIWWPSSYSLPKSIASDACERVFFFACGVFAAKTRTNGAPR